jgi:DNA-binding NtrC family response regulator
VEQGLTRTPSSPKRRPGTSRCTPAAPVILGATPAACCPGAQACSPQQNFALDQPLREARDAFEKAYFEYHLAKEQGSMTRVAEKTGLERTHLYRKLKQLGVDLIKGKRNVILTCRACGLLLYSAALAR